MPENRPLELKLFSNAEVLAVNQNGSDPRQLYKKDGAMVWYSHIPGSKSIYAALFNLSDEAKDVAIDFSNAGLRGHSVLRDLWQKRNLGTFNGSYKQKISPHGSVLLKLTPSE